jgi:cell division protein FtsI/penicillin-binding protein 2
LPDLPFNIFKFHQRDKTKKRCYANHSFIGFAPGNDPKFVMLVKFEKPKRTYAEVTAAPVFSDIARFALQYFQVPPER